MTKVNNFKSEVIKQHIKNNIFKTRLLWPDGLVGEA